MNTLSRTFKRRRDKEQGFTLVELLVVVIIIGILAAVSVPIYLNQRKAAWNSTALQDAKNAQVAMQSYIADLNGASFSLNKDCRGDNGPATSVKIGNQTLNCSAGVFIRVMSTHSGTGYIIYAMHANGGKVYTYNSETDSAVHEA